MRDIIFIVSFVAFSSLVLDSYCQLQVTPNNNPIQLAQTLAGAGVIVSGATMNCPSAANDASGTFVGTASNIGIAGGVLLTSGSVNNAVGPNFTSGGTTVNNGTSTFNDPNLMAIEPLAIYDVCILEFDAKPSCDTLRFTFVFGSEEYPEYVNSQFNDAFGIFVTGPNPSGANYAGFNMALIPSTTTPVAINNVNNGDGNSQPCPSNATTGPCLNCAYYTDNCSGTTVEYDGFTKPITVKLNVVPCGNYHFKLAIADAGDRVLDSGVFFALQSLVCNTSLAVATSTIPSSCTSNNGTATVTSVTGGVAPYTYTWNTVPPQGTQTATGLAPGNYIVTVIDANGCLSGTATVSVTGGGGGFTTTPLSTNVNCFGNNNGIASVTNPTGGTAPYTYAWSTNPIQTTSTISNIPAGNYTCVITDAAGCTQTATYTITQPTGMTLSITSTPTACWGNIGTAAVTSSCGVGPHTYLWLTNPVQTTPVATGLGAGAYTIIVTDANGCSKSQAVTVGGGIWPVANFTLSSSGTISLLNPLVVFTDGSTGNPTIWSWNFGDTSSGSNTSTAQNPSHVYSDTGNYCITLVISDPTGVCTDTVIKCLKVEVPFTFYIPNSFTPNGDGLNEFFTAYGTYIKEFDMMIFDRWGNKIWNCHTFGEPQVDSQCLWNGKVKRQDDLVQQDVYVWKVFFTDIYNKEHHYIGHVSVIK